MDLSTVSVIYQNNSVFYFTEISGKRLRKVKYKGKQRINVIYFIKNIIYFIFCFCIFINFLFSFLPA